MIQLLLLASAAIALILLLTFLVGRLLVTRTVGMSIRMQVFLALAVIVGAFALGLGVLVVDRVESRAVRLARQAAEDEATAIAGIVRGELARSARDMRQVAAQFDRERDSGADLRFFLLDARGTVLFPKRAPPAEDQAVVTVDKAVSVDGRVMGAVRVVKPTIVMRQLLWDFAPSVAITGVVLLAAAAFAAARIGEAIARPIEALSLFAERVSAGERSAISPPVFGREVRRLSSSIDSMRRQLEGRPFVETFAADLSHELKNPVAAIRASAELLEDGALEEPGEARRFVTRIRESTARIERLLGELLSLARIEVRGAEQFEPVAVGELASKAAETVELGARLRLRIDGDTRVRGDASWLTRAIANLLDNARVHGAQDQPVELSASRVGDVVRLDVVSSGEVPRAVRQRLFRRFVTTRADKGGTGLGLSIVRAVAEAHRGRAELVDAGPALVRFRISLPAATATPQAESDADWAP